MPARIPLRGAAVAAPGVIHIRNLSKRFPVRRGWGETFLRPFSPQYAPALTDVSLQVERGEFVGVLGPNGAGKTTLFKILSGMILPDAGVVEVCGHDVVRDLRTVRHALRPAVSEERSLLWRLSAYENLRLYAALYGLSGRRRDDRIHEVLDLVDLADTGTKMVAKFSSGMRQRLLIARALLTRPEVLLLDEPSRSLDPISARRLREFLRDEVVGDYGCTVLLATHSPEEALELCDRVVVLNRGHVLRSGAPSQLMQEVGGSHYRFWTVPAHQDRLVALAQRKGWSASVTSRDAGDGDDLWAPTTLDLPGGAEDCADFIGELVREGVRLGRVEEVRVSLAELIERIIEQSSAAERPLTDRSTR